MGYEIRQIQVEEGLAETELIEAHYEELALIKDLMVLKPDVAKYQSMQEAGILVCLGAFYEGKMIGYSANFVAPNLHYSDLVVAHNDVLFLAHSHRAGRIGLRLIQETERIVKEKGARLMIWHAKAGTPLEHLLPRIGYRTHDILLSKEI